MFILYHHQLHKFPTEIQHFTNMTGILQTVDIIWYYIKREENIQIQLFSLWKNLTELTNTTNKRLLDFFFRDRSKNHLPKYFLIKEGILTKLFYNQSNADINQLLFYQDICSRYWKLRTLNPSSLDSTDKSTP